MAINEMFFDNLYLDVAADTINQMFDNTEFSPCYDGDHFHATVHIGDGLRIEHIIAKGDGENMIKELKVVGMKGDINVLLVQTQLWVGDECVAKSNGYVNVDSGTPLLDVHNQDISPEAMLNEIASYSANLQNIIASIHKFVINCFLAEIRSDLGEHFTSTIH